MSQRTVDANTINGAVDVLKSMQSGGTLNSTQVKYVQYLPRPDSKGQNVRE
jgi:hypothetical protein